MRQKNTIQEDYKMSKKVNKSKIFFDESKSMLDSSEDSKETTWADMKPQSATGVDKINEALSMLLEIKNDLRKIPQLLNDNKLTDANLLFSKVIKDLKSVEVMLKLN